GHAMYSQNLPSDKYGTPLGESVSLGVHESQSRFWENFIGRSRPFWTYFFPLARSIFPGQLDHFTLDSFLQAINQVKPSFIRVEADEVTYNIHVYLRFVIEKELFEEKLEPENVPDRWNGLFQELFSMEVPNDTLGCLQDVHWSGAAFGYFPTYTLGNIYAAMLHERMRQEVPDMDALMERAEFGPILSWLKDKIHSKGQRYRPRRLIQLATQMEPSPRPLINYLEEKYAQLFHI
ncbi:MAG: carboxypeptidase M32, partial [Thermodesulfobacteria bacterium]|nr:carboxypeptidase M32 [Thermodesulfobacteriota bacterium]